MFAFSKWNIPSGKRNESATYVRSDTCILYITCTSLFSPSPSPSPLPSIYICSLRFGIWLVHVCVVRCAHSFLFVWLIFPVILFFAHSIVDNYCFPLPSSLLRRSNLKSVLLLIISTSMSLLLRTRAKIAKKSNGNSLHCLFLILTDSRGRFMVDTSRMCRMCRMHIRVISNWCCCCCCCRWCCCNVGFQEECKNVWNFMEIQATNDTIQLSKP